MTNENASLLNPGQPAAVPHVSEPAAVAQEQSVAQGQGQTQGTQITQQALDVAEKRRRDLQSYHDKMVAEKNAEIQRLQAQLQSQQAPAAVPQATPEPVAHQGPSPEALVAQSIDSHMSTYDVQMAQLHADQQKMKRDLAMEKLMAAHPDAVSMTQTPEFTQWISSKPKQVYDSVFNNAFDSAATIDTLNRYKAETAQAQGQTSMTQHNDPTLYGQGTQSAGTPATIEGMIYSDSYVAAQVEQNPNWYNENRADILKAVKEGRYINDMHKG